VFIVSQITDEDLTLEILSYKESLNFFPEGVNFENKNQDNPLVEVETLFPEREDYLNASISRIQNEGGVLKISKISEKTQENKDINIIYIFSNKEKKLMIVSLENSILLTVEQESISDILSEWYSSFL
jgi:hypothetical protein